MSPAPNAPIGQIAASASALPETALIAISLPPEGPATRYLPYGSW